MANKDLRRRRDKNKKRRKMSRVITSDDVRIGRLGGSRNNKRRLMKLVRRLLNNRGRPASGKTVKELKRVLKPYGRIKPLNRKEILGIPDVRIQKLKDREVHWYGDGSVRVQRLRNKEVPLPWYKAPNINRQRIENVEVKVSGDIVVPNIETERLSNRQARIYSDKLKVKDIAEMYGIKPSRLYSLARKETQRRGALVTVKEMHEWGYNLRQLDEGYRTRDFQKILDATWRNPFNHDHMRTMRTGAQNWKWGDMLQMRPLTNEELEDFHYLRQRYFDAYQRIIKAKGLNDDFLMGGLDPEGVLEVIRTFRRKGRQW